MSADELAAVIAVAQILFAGRDEADQAGGSRWALAARLHIGSAAQTRRTQHGSSRWALSGRLRD